MGRTSARPWAQRAADTPTTFDVWYASGATGHAYRTVRGVARLCEEDHDDQITGCCPFRAADAGADTQPALVCAASFEFSAACSLSSGGSAGTGRAATRAVCGRRAAACGGAVTAG